MKVSWVRYESFDSISPLLLVQRLQRFYIYVESRSFASQPQDLPQRISLSGCCFPTWASDIFLQCYQRKCEKSARRFLSIFKDPYNLRRQRLCKSFPYTFCYSNPYETLNSCRVLCYFHVYLSSTFFVLYLLKLTVCKREDGTIFIQIFPITCVGDERNRRYHHPLRSARTR